MTQQPNTQPLFKEPRFTQEDTRHDVTVTPLRRGLKQRIMDRKRPARITPKKALLQDAKRVSPQELEASAHALQTAKGYMQALQWNEAITYLNNALDLNPQAVSAWQALGQAYHALDVSELAFDAFQEVLRLDPFNTSVLKPLANLSETLRVWDKTVHYYQRYISVSSASEGDYFSYAVALEHQERFADAIAIYDTLVAKDAKHLPALNNRAGCYMNLNEYEQAIAGFRHVLSIMPNFSRAILGLAIAQDMAGQPAHAILGYRRYLHLQPCGGHAQTVQERLQELGLLR
jgi:tetratricopeptide (TPR) repeat protein